jgi:SecD/SecF fusion protein
VRGGFAISLQFTREGATLFEDATRRALSGQVVPRDPSLIPSQILIVLDDEIISSPVVNEVIAGGNAQITGGAGGFSQHDAVTLAALIRGGALPVELIEESASTRTATIGIDALERSVRAGAIGLALLFLLMFVMYRVIGFAANIALALYVVIILWILVAIDAVLTLPGVAGIILSIGMATDANVIIFSRIREEICSGKTVRAAIQSGFKRALNTVIDAQLTTLIAAIVLWFAGTSSVMGFALTLMIGIVVSVFTAVVVTQLYLIVFGESKKFSAKKYFGVNENNEPTFRIKRQIKFVQKRKIFYIASMVFIVIGLSLGLFTERGFNYGIDFTGGTMMQIDMGRQVEESAVLEVMSNHGVSSEVVFAGANNEQVIIRTMQDLDVTARAAILSEMESRFNLAGDYLLAMDLFGPAVSMELRNSAVWAVIIASLGILIYIIIRFEWKSGISTLVGIGHDVLFVLAFYAIFNITINNPFIAGMLTVVGYSMNDSVVIFDRLRENLGFMRKNKTEEIIDISVNQTLSRSIMTSVTTLAVMAPLMFMTTPAISEFILPLMVGVNVGTFSSIGICSPIYYELSRLTGGQKYKGKKSKKSSKYSERDTERERDRAEKAAGVV